MTPPVPEPAAVPNTGKRVHTGFLETHRPHIATWAIGALIFFHRPFTTGFDSLNGDQGDVRLIALIHEHLFKAMTGVGSWNSPNFFYPTKNVLGYSDTFALNEIFYVPLRLIGFDRYVAMQWTFILLSVVGFFGMTLLIEKSTKLPRLWVCCLATTFTFANSLSMKNRHPQMYSVYWLPWVVLAFIVAAKTVSDRKRCALCFGGGGLLAMVLYSSFYVGWFAIFALGIFTIFFSVLEIVSSGAPSYFQKVSRQLNRVAAALFGFGLGLLPFLYTYLPVLGATERRAYSVAMGFAGRPGDLLNVSKWNVLWGPLAERLISSAAVPTRLIDQETALAVTPVLLVVTVGFGLYSFRVKRSERTQRANAVIALTFTLAVLTVVSIKFAFGSLWIVPYSVLPGANALRAIHRIQVFNGFIAVLTLGLGLDLWRANAVNRADSSPKQLTSASPEVSMIRPTRSTRYVRLISALLLIVTFEQLNTNNLATLDHSDEVRLLSVIADPPKSCRQFYALGRPGDRFEVVQIDAMIIASVKRIPTLNGYSGQFPKSFPVDAASPGYPDAMRAWAKQRGMTTGLCTLDLATRHWTSNADS